MRFATALAVILGPPALERLSVSFFDEPEDFGPRRTQQPPPRRAARVADRPRKRDTPDELKSSNRYLVDTLQLRADGMAGIARLLPTALGDQGAGAAISGIAAQMQTFLASDVIYTVRYLRGLYATIKDQ